MTTLRTAAQQALEAMHCAVPTGEITLADWYKSITALKAALAEHDKKIVWVEERKAHWAEQLQLARETQERERQQREEAALAEPIEPVALAWSNLEGTKFVGNGEKWKHKDCVVPLYTAAPQRKPLSEEEIDNIWDSEKAFADIYAIARAIERAHGIT